MQTVILCGGTGTRAYPHTLELPKPLMQVGDRPILLHLMQIYARQGFDRFVLSAGYRADLVAKFAADLETGWQVEVIDTGERTGTAGRIIGCAPVLGRTFLATYGDGLGSINVKALLEFHSSHPGAMTVTAVPLPSPYGTALASWVDLQNPANSIAIRARAPAHPSPEARAFARARALGSETKSYVYEVQWPGGRTAWEVLYVDHKVHTALFEYDACSPAIAMTVTLNASGSSRLFDMEHTLPQGAEPVCDGSAFASPDRADVAVPLKLPASS